MIQNYLLEMEEKKKRIASNIEQGRNMTRRGIMYKKKQQKHGKLKERRTFSHKMERLGYMH
jgi:hypothetical protein